MFPAADPRQERLLAPERRTPPRLTFVSGDKMSTWWLQLLFSVCPPSSSSSFLAASFCAKAELNDTFTMADRKSSRLRLRAGIQSVRQLPRRWPVGPPLPSRRVPGAEPGRLKVLRGFPPPPPPSPSGTEPTRATKRSREAGGGLARAGASQPTQRRRPDGAASPPPQGKRDPDSTGLKSELLRRKPKAPGEREPPGEVCLRPKHDRSSSGSPSFRLYPRC